METLKIDCMAETVNGVSYRQESKSNINDSLELDNETLQDMLQPMRITQEDLNKLSITADEETVISSNWRMHPIAVNVSDAISTSVISDYMKFTNDFNEMVKRILGDNEVVFHTEEYLEGLPSKIIHEFCKDLCIMLLEEYNDSEVWTSQIIKSIASSSGRKIDSLHVYDVWHTIARLADLGFITAEDLGVSKKEFEEHISWYKLKEGK